MKQSETQNLSEIKGRPMLNWYGKKPLQSIEYFPAQEKEFYGDVKSKDFNKLFWGDNLQVLSHLLKKYRGKVDLIYIDPPFDSKAEYVKNVNIKGEKIKGQTQSILEEKQYTDIWENDEYLQFMYERLQIMRELLSNEGSIYVHVDWHKASFMRILMDEIFGESNFQREIIWRIGWVSGYKSIADNWIRNHETILYYAKDKSKRTFNKSYVPYPPDYERWGGRPKGQGLPIEDVWGVFPQEGVTSLQVVSFSYQDTNYPTQKPEGLLERIIKASSNEGDLVMDCFCGSGTTLAVAQKLGRKWLGCDINLGAIQITTKRISHILNEQSKNQKELIKTKTNSLSGFKVYNVNEYDIFKNELEAKEIIIDIYGIEPIKRNYFDGELDNKIVKIMPLNRVLNKIDIIDILKNINNQISQFTPKKSSKIGESTFEESVLIIASGIENDIPDFIKKENKTGVSIEVRDIQTDKKSLIFKTPTEAKVKFELEGKKVTIELEDFYSPILVKKIELENDKIINKENKTKLEDYKQIIDSLCIDLNYNNKLFNAEIMDLPEKKEVIKGKYVYEYESAGIKNIAIKIVDVLGEEYFETFKVELK